MIVFGTVVSSTMPETINLENYVVSGSISTWNWATATETGALIADDRDRMRLHSRDHTFSR